MSDREIINWLLAGDVSIQYQAKRDLLAFEDKDLQSRIEEEGWGRKLLSLQTDSGHWGRGFYQPKWTSSHYTILDLKNLGIAKSSRPILRSLETIIVNQKARDGGINPAKTTEYSDVCINGMALNYFAYFNWNEKELESIVDFILSEQMDDGGFNCHSNTKGARHSSLHTTLSILEGILEYKRNGYEYRTGELLKAENESREFILEHRLFKSDKTGEIIDRKMLTLSYPSRWRYDILRALEYFQASGAEYDERMDDAIGVIMKKRRKDRRWNLQANHPGALHFEMEKVGQPGRWNTLRSMRVLRHFEIDE